MAPEEQEGLIDRLNQIVRSSDAFQRAEAADRLIKIPSKRACEEALNDPPSEAEP